MNKPRVLSKSISSLLVIGVAAAIPSAHGATRIWDGGGVSGTNFGTPVNWSDDTLPDVITGDTALWDGTVAGPLALIYSDAAFLGAAGNLGINLSLAATQSGSLNIDSGANTNALRLNNISIAAGAGAFSLGNGSNTFNLALGGNPGETHTWTNNSANTATVLSDVVFALGGGGAHTLAIDGTGNWRMNNVISNGGGTMALTKTGNGTLTLNAANTYTGVNTISGGTVAIGADNNLGATAATVTLNGGTLKVTPPGGSVTNTHVFTIGASGGTINVNSPATQNLTYIFNTAGLLTGSGALTVTSNGSLGVSGLNSGVLVLNQANTTFTGNLILQDGGIVEYGNNTGIGATATATLGNNGNISISTANGATTTFANNIAVNGTGSILSFQNGDGASVRAVSGNIALNNDLTVGLRDWYNWGTGRNGVVNGIISGSGGLNVIGPGATLTLGAANTYTGATAAFNSGLTLTANATSSIAGSASTTLNNSTLTMDYTAGNVDKLKDTGTVTSRLNAFLVITGNASADTTETIGTLALDRGNSTVTIGSQAGRVTKLAAGALSRTNNAVPLLRGTNLDQSAATNVSRITLADGGASLSLVGTNTLNNGAVTETTQALKIVPYLVGGTAVASNGTNFVTYDSTLGLRVLQAGEQTALTDFYTTAANPDNALAFSGTLATASDVTINSLKFDTATQTLNGSGGKLIVNSGAILVSDGLAAEVIGSGFSGLTLGNGVWNEGIITTAGAGVLTVNTPISVTGGGGLTKGGGGTLTLGAVNTYTGSTTIGQGTLAVAAGVHNVFNGTTGTAMVLTNNTTLNINNTVQRISSLNVSGAGGAVSGAGGTLNLGGNVVWDATFNPNAGFTISVSNLNLNGTRTFNIGDSIQVVGAEVTVSSVIGDGTAASGLTKEGAGLLALSGANAYTGLTTVNAGILQIGAAGATGGLTGNVLNNATLTFNRTDILGTYNGVISGGGLLIQGGTGITTLSGASTYTGKTAIRAGTLSVSSLNSVVGGTASSNLGAPTTVANGTIDIGFGGTAGNLNYTGTGEITDRNINLAGSNAAATITQSGAAGLLKFTGNIFGTLNGAKTLTLQGSTAGTGEISGVIMDSPVGATGVTKSGTGLWSLTGSNTYTGATTVNRGTLKIDFSAAGAPTANIVNSVSNLSGLVLAHGTLNVTGKASTANVQQFNGLTANAGHSLIVLAPNATANPLLLSLGGLTRNAGGTVDFPLPIGVQNATNGITTTTLNTNGILGAFTIGGTDWAANATNLAGGNIVGFSTVGSYTLSSAAGSTAANYLNFNIDVDSSQTPAAAITPNSLRFNAAGANTLTLTGTNVITSGGILVNSSVGANLSTITGGTLQGANTRDLAIYQNNTGGALAISSIIANNTGATGVTKSGPGVLTLSGVNTYTGNTTLNEGTLNINNAAAIGNTTTGGLFINGGTIDNTSGAAITLAAVKAISINGDFTFTGTQGLNFGATSVATLTGPQGTRTMTINAGTLTVERVVGSIAYNFVKAGAGTLLVTGGNETTGLQGLVTITGGKLVGLNDITLGALAGSGTVENGGSANKWLRAGSNGLDTTFSGNIQNGTATLGFTKQGFGTMTLTGSNNVSELRVEVGGLAIPAGTTTFNAGSLIGANANVVGSINVNGGTLSSPTSTLTLGTGASTNGFLKMSSGTINIGGELQISNGNNAAMSFGAVSVSGGTMAVGSWFHMGRLGNGILNLSGGTINHNGTAPYTHSQDRADIVGVTNITGGTLNINTTGGNGGIWVANQGQGIFNLSAGAVNISTATTQGFNLANGGGAGIANLNGSGVLTTNLVRKSGGGAGTLNFGGGTLRAGANNATFMQGLTNAYINAGGATIDTNNFNVTISQPLVAPTGNGVNGIASFTGGAGYVDTPIVTVQGDGVGATAVATVSGGVVTGITITNPGVGYTATPTFTLIGGGARIPATITGTAPTPNVGGGLTKSGAGSLTLSGINTYSGATSVTGGTLRISDTGSINGSSGVTINGSGARLAQNSFDPLAPTVTVTNGALDGTGVVNAVTVGNGTGGVITHGDGGLVPLTIGSLTFTGAATVNLTTTLTTDTPLITTSLATAAGAVTINPTNSSGIWSTGIYNLISYSTLGGSGFGSFLKGTVPGLGARQSAALSNPAGFIALTITGDLPVWTGAESGAWTTSVIGGAKNWVLQTAATPTDFIAGDSTLFDDSATGTTTVNISTANVSPTITTFNNSAVDYTISSTGGFGIVSGSVSKSGTAAATLQTANTYAGGTTVNAGTLNINHSSAIGTGTLTVAGGTIDNTSGAPITLSTNNAQAWTGDFAFGGTNDLNLGTGAVALPAQRIITTNGTGKLTVGGVISGTGFGINKVGPGTLELTGANTYTGATTVESGTLRVTGAINAANTANIGQITVGTSPDTAVMRIAGATINATKTANPSIVVGGAGGSSGVLIMDGGTLASVELWLGDGGGSYGGMTLNSGTVSTSGWLPVSRTGSAVLNVTGGSITTTGQNIVLSSFGGANGDLNASGGTITTTSVAANQGALIVGEAGTGVLDVSGTAAINISGALGVNIARVGGGNGIVNLRGGTVTTPAVTKGAAGNSAILNFNGGTLRPTASSATFMTGLTAANIFAGGANIHTNGQNITIAQPLLAPTANGVSSVAIDDGGAGYLHTPVVRLSGGVGSGATAVANITGGVITGITITNPGSGYAPDDVLFASIVGGGATTPATLGTITLAANSTTGGLTKQGAGTLTLSGTNTYGGTTTVSAGTLTLEATGTINSSSGITINGATAKLLQSNVAPTITPTITVTNGVLDGTGTVNSVIVSNGTGGIVTNGNGGTGVLTIGTLFFSGVGTANINTTGGVGIATTGLTTNGVGTVTLNVPVGLPWATGATYNLISYGAFSGAANHFLAGTVSGLGARQVATPVINGSNIAITIGGDAPVWTGSASGLWTTAAVGTPFNWKLQVGGTNTEFITNDQVLFDDTATGTTNITINDPTVAAAGITFNNSTKNYTISGTNGIVSGLLAKNGTGSLTISTANSYAGGTTLNAGTLNINNSTALGTGTFTINAGTIDNTSGSAITMTNNNAQNWNGDFTFAGTNNLNMGTGTATIGGAGSSRQITVNAGVVSIGSINGTGGAGYSLTKAGAGTLTVGSAVSNLGGDLNVTGGTLQIGASNFLATGLSGTATVENGSGIAASLVINNSGDRSFSGILQNGGGGGTLGLIKQGTGTQTLAGLSSYTGATTVSNGTLSVVTGGAINNPDATVGQMIIGNTAGINAVLEIAGGTVRSRGSNLLVGNGVNGSGFIKMSSGNLSTGTNEFQIGGANDGNAGYGAFSMSGGTMLSGSWLVVGFNNDRAVVNQSGGSTTVQTNRLTIGAGGAGAVGVVNVSGGTLTSNAGIYIGENGTGTLNISGAGIVTAGDTRFNHVATSLQGSLSVFGGGALNTTGFSGGPGVGQARLNLNGGTLRATANNANFLADLASTEATIYSGGATIDTQAFNITIAEPLLAPIGGGVTSIDLIDGGAGYIDTPVVRLSGGSGTGATAVANVSGGVVTGFTITNPGSGYDLGDFLTATIEGGGATTPATISTINLAGNATTGGLTKTGSGTLTLTSANTYGGATTVNQGTLAFGVSETLSSLVIADGATVVLLQSAPAPAEGEGAGLAVLGSPEGSDALGVADGGVSQMAAVPEPGAIGLLMAGAIGLLGRRRRSSRTTASSAA